MAEEIRAVWERRRRLGRRHLWRTTLPFLLAGVSLVAGVVLWHPWSNGAPALVLESLPPALSRAPVEPVLPEVTPTSAPPVVVSPAVEANVPPVEETIPPPEAVPEVPAQPPALIGSEQGRYSVQVMALASSQQAQDIARNLEQVGYRAFVVAGRWHKVRIGRFERREEAEQARNAMVAQGYTDALILQSN
ncbi:MAG: SPOR domain-containing protein [Deinococcus sp.]|nr:SPOR domain-containing protein [Deinococcus sp.]